MQYKALDLSLKVLSKGKTMSTNGRVQVVLFQWKCIILVKVIV